MTQPTADRDYQWLGQLVQKGEPLPDDLAAALGIQAEVEPEPPEEPPTFPLTPPIEEEKPAKTRRKLISESEVE